MKPRVFASLALLAAGVRAADLPSFDFKTHTFATPPLKLGDMFNNKPLSLAFSSPTFRNMPEGFRPMFSPKPQPQMRIVKPRTDIDFKMIIKEPDPNIDPKFAVPALQRPAKLGGGK